MSIPQIIEPVNEAEINHPPHYNSLGARCENCGTDIECKTVIGEMKFRMASAIKYIWRCDHKGQAIKDLKKAVWYLQEEIKRRELSQYGR